MNKIVAGIDPGTANSSYVIWDGSFILAKGEEANEKMIDVIWGWSERELFPGTVGIECVQSYGMEIGQEVLDCCFWSGRFAQATCEAGLNFTKAFRPAIKAHLCNAARAKDKNVRQALIDRLGSPGTKKQMGVTYGVSSHCWSALAVAVYVFDNVHSHARFEPLTKPK